jgi:hypothetical protein
VDFGFCHRFAHVHTFLTAISKRDLLDICTIGWMRPEI